MDSGYYKVVVKIEEENGISKTGKPKFKHLTEMYIVKAGSPQIAANRVQEEMNGCQSEWRIDSVKEVKIAAIL
jgi:hypothetical protein